MRRHAKASSAGSTLGIGSSRGLFGRAFACLVVLAAFAGSSAPSAGAAVTAKGVTGYFGATGEAGGQLNTPRGSAVNQTSGNVYVADSANNRIAVFNSSGTFLRAFGQDVIASGPDNNGTGYEICVAANGDVCKAGITTASTGGAMQAPQGVALDASGNVYVSEQNKLRVQKFDSEGHFLLALGRNVVLSGPSNGPATAEVQSIKVAGGAGTFTLTFSGQTTSGLPYNATANEVETALNQLSTIGGVGGSVSVSGGPGDGNGTSPFVVTFGGSLNGVNVEQITLNASSLQLAVGATLTCTTPTNATTKNFQWLRNGVPIGGATSSTYTTVVADQGTLIQCQVFALNATAGLTQASLARLIVAPAPATTPPTPPASIGAPTPISAPVGTTETCKAGTWEGSPSFSYQWYRNGTAIAGATAETYTLVAADIPSVIQCAVTGTNAGGAATLVSANRNTSPAPSNIPTAATPTAGISAASTLTEGSSAKEICSAAAGDVCQAGVTGSAGGEFGAGFNGYLAVAPAGAPNAGDVLVADPGNRRVQEFTSGGVFVRAFGWDVKTGGVTTFEVCEVAAECTAGVAGSGSGQFASETPTRIAEDAEGNIYTVESGANFRVQKFTLPGNVVTPGGSFSEANLKGTNAATAPLDVTIDPQTKDVLVTKGFTAGATPTCPNTGLASVAEQRVVEVSSTGTLEATHMACAAINSVNGLSMRSSASTGDIYVSSTTGESRLYVLNAPLVAPTVGFSGISGVSAHSATVSGFVNPNGPALAYGLTTGYHLNYKRSTDASFTAFPPSDVTVGKGTTNQLVSQQLIGLEANATYEVQIVAARQFNGGNASTSIFSFTTPAAAPEVSTPTATTGDASGTVASLYGFVNPNSQATTYRFEYGLTESYGTSAPAAGGSAGSGGNAIAAAQTLNGLQPGTTYHFRLRANNVTGAAVSADQTFTTAEPADTALPDNRGLELVSPPDKRPAGYVGQVLEANLNWQIADNGQSAAYVLQNGLADATAGGESLYLARRSSDGWHSTQSSPPALVPSVGGGTSSKTFGYSPNLTCSFYETNSPLNGEVPQEDIEHNAVNLWRGNEDGSYTLISNQVPSNIGATSGESSFEFGGLSNDCSKAYFTSTYSYLPGASGLYEWNNGVLHDAGRLPDGTVPSARPALGGEGGSGEASTTRYNAVSEDGRRVFFTSTSDEGGDKGQRAVFMRQDGTTTVDVSKPTTTTPSLGARYETASPDGNHVFFAANPGLAGSAGVAPQEAPCGSAALFGTAVACDLYDYNTETAGLTDLTTDFNPQDTKGAAVSGVVAVSRNGSYVYFAAKGQLVPTKGKTYAEDIGATPSSNVYLYHAGQLSFVANVRDTDLGGGSIASIGANAMLTRSRSNWSSYATPSGKYLVFESRSSVTGYESGNNAEAYIYSADKQTLTCVSCRANGQQSPLVLAGLVVTTVLPGRANFQLSVRAMHYNRPMSDDGQRVFFFSTDALAPGAVSGTRNIYEWENGKVSLLSTSEGKLIGTSTSGDDVFFTSRKQLVTQDFDLEPDLYDARVGGGFPPLETTTPCDPAADQCQGSPAPQPGPPSAPSQGFSGAGNPPAPSPPKKHQKRHHKKKHHKRKHKQRTADSRTGARAGTDNRGGGK